MLTRLASAPRNPAFAGNCSKSPKIVSASETGKLDFFGAKDFYEPVLTRHGAELLQQGVEHYIQAKDKTQLGNAYRWVRQLLTHEVNPNLNPTQDMPVLNRALGANKTALAELLKKYGAQSASEEALYEVWRSLGDLIKHHGVASEQDILNVLKTPGFNVNQVDHYGRTLLGWAVGCWNDRVVSALLKAGANPNQPGNLYKDLPLPLAVLNNDVKVVRHLLNADANANVSDRYGKTALQIAKMYGFREIQKMLKEHGATEPAQNL